jgi:hypothetical protein
MADLGTGDVARALTDTLATIAAAKAKVREAAAGHYHAPAGPAGVPAPAGTPATPGGTR